MTSETYDVSELRWEYPSWSEDDIVDLGGVPVPRTFIARLEHPLWPARVDLAVTVYPDRGPMATGLSVVDPKGALPDPFGYHELDDIISRTIDRARLLQEVTAQAAGVRIALLAHERLLGGQELSEAERAELRSRIVAGARRATDLAYGAARPRRRTTLNRERLREVADVYRAAAKAGKPPTKAVAEHWTVAHSTASKWVQRARKEGVLGAAKGTKPGEDQQDGVDQ